MNIDEYSSWTDKVWKSGVPSEDMSHTDLSIVGLGLAGETGEALEYVKKYLRDGKNFRKEDEFAKEMGDIIFYWCRLVAFAGYKPSEILDMNIKKLTKRHQDRLK